MKWIKVTAGYYVSDNERFTIKLEDMTRDNWFLYDNKNPDELYGHWTLKGCKEIAEERLKCCENCKWWTYEEIDQGHICCNSESHKCAEWTEEDYFCDEWEKKDDNLH